MKIVLLRHGQPAYDLFAEAKRRVASAELRQVILRYNESPLNPTVVPSDKTCQLAQSCTAVVCSNLTRSIESAHMLGHDAIHLIDPVFRESDLPHADWRFPRLSLYSWFITFRLLWLLGYAKNGEAIKLAKQRAVSASNILISLAQEHESVLLAGHGFMNRFIARQLRASGWHGPKDPGKHYWEYGVYYL